MWLQLPRDPNERLVRSMSTVNAVCVKSGSGWLRCLLVLCLASSGLFPDSVNRAC